MKTRMSSQNQGCGGHERRVGALLGLGTRWDFWKVRAKRARHGPGRGLAASVGWGCRVWLGVGRDAGSGWGISALPRVG